MIVTRIRCEHCRKVYPTELVLPDRPGTDSVAITRCPECARVNYVTRESMGFRGVHRPGLFR